MALHRKLCHIVNRYNGSV